MSDYQHWPTSKYYDGGYPKRHYKKFVPLKDEEGNIPAPEYLHYENDTQSNLDKALHRLIEGDATVILLGPRGTGKTQAAVQLAYQLELHQKKLSQHGTHYYTQLGQLFEEEKQSWKIGPQKDALNTRIPSPVERSKKAQLLVLDELQECSNSDWERQSLTRLIDSRYQNEMNTILVGNLTVDALGEFLSKSVTSRLKETGYIIEMTQKKYR